MRRNLPNDYRWTRTKVYYKFYIFHIFISLKVKFLCLIFGKNNNFAGFIVAQLNNFLFHPIVFAQSKMIAYKQAFKNSARPKY